MFGDVIVPTDGSATSFTALASAAAIAKALDRTVRVVGYYDHGGRDDLADAIDRHAPELGDAKRTVHLEALSKPVALLLHDRVIAAPDSLICMSTHGRGRSSAMVGSVTTEVLAMSHFPVVLIGPECSPGALRLDGPMLVPIDGTEFAELVVPVAEAFAIVFDYDIELVSVLDPKEVRRAGQILGSDVAVVESNLVRNVARRITATTDLQVQTEVLHDHHPAASIVAHAKFIHASLIAMATHNERGISRLMHGSVAAAVVRYSPCPVIAMRPAEL